MGNAARTHELVPVPEATLLRTAEGKLDLLGLLIHLYDRLPRDETAFLQATAAAVQTLASAAGLVADEISVVDAERSNAGLSYRRTGATTPTEWRINTGVKHHRPPRRWLTFLEEIGHDLLASDVYFADPARRIPLRNRHEYERWSTGRSKRADPDAPLQPVNPSPTPVTFLWPFLDCYRRAFGPVGPYWAVPMLWLVVGMPLGSTALRRVRVACPTSLPQGLTVAPRAICSALPAGCDVRYHWWPRGTWWSHGPLVNFVMFYQCQVLAGDLGGWQRERGPRGDAYFPLDAAVDDMLLVTVGGVPVATAGVQAGKHDGEWYLSALCAATRTTAGSLAIQHLQSHGRPLVADATADSVGFYVRHGFVGNATDRQMEWVPPRNKARRAV